MRIVPSCGVNLSELPIRFEKICRKRSRSHSSSSDLSSSSVSVSTVRSSGERVQRLHALAQQLGDAVRRALDREPPGLDAREVEQVAQQALHAVRRAVHRFDVAPDALAGLVVGQRLEQQRAAHQHAGERIAQIVRDDTEQVLARADRLARFEVQPRVVDRHRRAQREVLGHLQVVRAVACGPTRPTSR